VRWVRTWPAKIPTGRAHVADLLPRIEMTGYNYVPVLEQLDGDTVIVEWDLAVSYEDRALFTAACLAEPDRVRVAAYRLYPRSTALPEPVWAHRRWGRHPGWITEGEPFCDMFSFGLVYLPHAIVGKYLATGPEVTGDSIFSQWHHDQGLGPVPVAWDVQPVHLHY
jgi:hypothetical protein